MRKPLKKGTRLTVVGIPRVSLKLVDWRIAHHTGQYSGSLTWNLPYELVVVGITESDQESVHDEDSP